MNFIGSFDSKGEKKRPTDEEVVVLFWREKKCGLVRGDGGGGYSGFERHFST